jgi:hypothetical protein
LSAALHVLLIRTKAQAQRLHAIMALARARRWRPDAVTERFVAVGGERVVRPPPAKRSVSG